MTSTLDHILVQCANCGDRERNQKLLLCLHACCERCIEEAGETEVVCKICTTTTSTKRSDLRRNILQTVFREHVKLTEPRVCFVCEEDGKYPLGTHICFECDSYHLCESCVKKHRKFPISRTHNPVPFIDLAGGGEVSKDIRRSSDGKPCPKHHKAREPHWLSLFCKECSTPVCQLCVLTSHARGDHDIVTMEDMAKDLTDEIKHETAPLRDGKETISRGIVDSLDRLESLGHEKEQMRNDLQGRITSLRQSINEIIDRTTTDYVDRIDGFFFEQSTSVLMELARRENLSKKVEHALAFSGAFLDNSCYCTYPELSESSSFLIQQLKVKNSELQSDNLITNEQSLCISNPKEILTDEFVRSLVGHITVQGSLLGGPIDIDIQGDDREVKPNNLLCSRPIEKILRNLENDELELELLWSVESKLHSYLVGMDFTETGDIVMGGKAYTQADSYGLEVYTVHGKRLPDIPHGVSYACQVTVDDDDVYIGDLDRGRVLKIDIQDPQHRAVLISERCHKFAVDATRDRAFLLEKGTSHVLSCKKDGLSTTRWSAPEVQLSDPRYLCLTPSGDLVVCCWDHPTCSIASDHSGTYIDFSVNVLGPDGNIKYTYGSTGSDDGELRFPLGLCADNDGRIYIADQMNGRISVISPQGKFLTHILTSQRHGITSPTCVKISPGGDLIGVLHSFNIFSLFKIVKK